MYRLRANSRATISSTAIFLSQQSRQYFSSPRGSETSLAPQSAQRDLATDLRGILSIYHLQTGISDAATKTCRPAPSGSQRPAPRGDAALLYGHSRVQRRMGT